MPAPALKPWHNTAKNEFYVRVVFNDGLHPPERRFPLGVSDLQDVDARIRDFRDERLPGILRERAPAADTTNLRDAFSWYITSYLPDLGRKPKTIDAYDRILHDFTTYCRTRHIGRVEQISADLFREWQKWRGEARANGRGDSPGAKRDELLCVRQFFDVCADEGKLPALKIKWTIPGKTRSRRFRALDPQEFQFLRDTLEKDPPRPYLLLHWMIDTPWLPSDTIDFRSGEYRGDYIDRDRIKTSRQMLYPVTAHMAEIIAEAKSGRTLKRDAHVFVNRDDAPWQYHQLEKQTRWWQKKHGLDFTFRDLRVTFATRLANAGCPPNVLAELMSHEDIETTLQYYVRVDLTTMRAWATHVTSPTYVPITPAVYPVQEYIEQTQ